MLILLKNEMYKILKQKKTYIFLGIITIWILLTCVTISINPSGNNLGINGQLFPLNILRGMYTFIIIFMTVLIAEMVTNEYKNGTLKQTLLRPLSRIQVLNAKVASLFIWVIIIQVFVLIISYILGTISFGWGNGFIFSGTKLSLSGDWISIKQSFSGINGVLFMINTYLLSVLQFMATGMVIFFISLIFSNIGATIATSLGLWIVLPPILQTIKPIRPFLLDSYFYFVSAFLQDIEIKQVLLGLIVISVYGITFYLASIFLFKDKDILF